MAIGSLELGMRSRRRFGSRHTSIWCELELDLEGLLQATTAEYGEHVLGDPANDNLGLHEFGFHDPREHALADERSVGFGEVVGVDGIVDVVGEKFWAGVGDASGTLLEIDNTNSVGGIQGDSLNLQSMRVACEIIRLRVMTDRVGDLDYIEHVVSSRTHTHANKLHRDEQSNQSLVKKARQPGGEGRDIRPISLT